ncbi:MAG: gamma-glutamyl-gamma-aminobutyrate hydrolase family protein [Planctomycetota bacterium]
MITRRAFVLVAALLAFAPLAIAQDAPVIGITTVFRGEDSAVRDGKAEINMTYVEAVREAGGLPVLIPPGVAADESLRRRYMELCDGMVFVGGADVPPSFYGEQQHETVYPLKRTRFDAESSLMAEWLAGEKPVLGVCLGSQMMTVCSGGSLIQDIPTEVGKGVTHGGGASHEVDIVPATRLASILDGARRIEVNSYHHQASDVLGEGFIVSARSPDGVTEAIERPGPRFVVGVQWHPERSTGIDRQLFRALVEAVELANQERLERKLQAR